MLRLFYRGKMVDFQPEECVERRMIGGPIEGQIRTMPAVFEHYVISSRGQVRQTYALATDGTMRQKVAKAVD